MDGVEMNQYELQINVTDLHKIHPQHNAYAMTHGSFTLDHRENFKRIEEVNVTSCLLVSWNTYFKHL